MAATARPAPCAAGRACDTASMPPSFPGRGDGLRASDAERDRAVAELADRYAEGRIGPDTFSSRMDIALRARHRGELHDLLADLPPGTRMARLRAGLTSAFHDLNRAAQAGRLPLLNLPREPRPMFTIGRDQACDLILGDQSVSRFHARLSRAAGGWLLGDLDSTNGTMVNGWRIRHPVALRAGDRVSFGAMNFSVADAADRPAG